jgi:hypothetical protein
MKLSWKAEDMGKIKCNNHDIKKVQSYKQLESNIGSHKLKCWRRNYRKNKKVHDKFTG